MEYVHRLVTGTPVVLARGRLRQRDLRFLVSLGYKALRQKKKKSGGGDVGKSQRKDMYMPDWPSVSVLARMYPNISTESYPEPWFLMQRPILNLHPGPLLRSQNEEAKTRV